MVESAEFSKMVQKSLNTEQQKEKEQPVVDPGDIEEWLDVFGGGKPKVKDQD